MFKKLVTVALLSYSAQAQEALPQAAGNSTEPATVAAATAAAPAKEALTEAQRKQVDHLLDQIDFQAIEDRVRANVRQELLEKDFKKALETEMTQQVEDVVASYAQLTKKWDDLDKELTVFGDAAWTRFRGLTAKQMLKATMDKLNTADAVKELWKNSTPEDKEKLEDLNVNFNLKSGEVSLASEAKDSTGNHPLFEWTMDTNSGKIEETTRTGDRDHVVEKVVDPEALGLGEEFFKVDLKKSEAPAETPKESESALVTTVASSEWVKVTKDTPLSPADEKEWNDMEKQRDVAFKIMYFFIVFIIATFGLLYTYFKMS
jgi:hypothetical protein